jgi:hypothetical protein
MLFSFYLSASLFLLVSSNLLLSLILLEILGFLLLGQFSHRLSLCCDSDFVILFLFSVLVIEGVIALSGIITLVTFTGSASVSSSRLTKC